MSNTNKLVCEIKVPQDIVKNNLLRHSDIDMINKSLGLKYLLKNEYGYLEDVFGDAGVKINNFRYFFRGNELFLEASS
jgi:hypothetical protein